MSRGDDARDLEPGTLYLVATPIGNLEDMSPRALAVLGAADLILAEDTRHSRRLLEHFGLHRPLQSWHEHNERAGIDAVLERLGSGAAVALVSDAGMPLISDPGYPLVRAVHRAGLRVCPVPGPSALLAALAASGLPTDRFFFEGFLPPRPAARRARLQALRGQAATLVFYEAARRVAASLADMAEVLGAGRPACLARELTKRHEHIRPGTLGALAGVLAAGEEPARGEFVVVVGGCPPPPPGAPTAEQLRVLEVLAAELPASRAAALAAALTGADRKALYRWLSNRPGRPGGSGPAAE